MPSAPLAEADIKDMVRRRYGGIAAGTAPGCCGSTAPAGCGQPSAAELMVSAEAQARAMGYSDADVAAIPEGANLGLGCGNPQAIAAIKPGEVIVDLGSGAGFDCLLAARQAGPTGHVIGVDMTHEMLAKARANAARTGTTNVDFRLGELEHLPVADNTADVILSNCVINLVPDKAQVFREAFRVLKPGGRLAISDVINIAPLAPALTVDPGLICGCVAGAVPSTQIELWLQAAGFRDARVAIKPESRELVASWAPGLGVEHHVAAATIQAVKPAAGETPCCAPACCA